MIPLYKSFFKMSIVVSLICITLACGRKEPPPQPKEQEDPTVTAVKALFKKWDEALNSNDPDRFLEMIPDEIKEHNPEEAKKICTELLNELRSSLKDMHTSVDRIVIDNNEGTKATVYVTLTAIDLKTQKPSKDSTSYPIIKEADEWKIDAKRQAEISKPKSAVTQPMPAPPEPKPRSGLVGSLSYEGWKYGYHIFHAEVNNEGDKIESISPSNFVLVTENNESIEAEIPFHRYLLSYKHLLNLHVLPKTSTSGYLFFKTANQVQYVVFLPTGAKISFSD